MPHHRGRGSVPRGHGPGRRRRPGPGPAGGGKLRPDAPGHGRQRELRPGAGREHRAAEPGHRHPLLRGRPPGGGPDGLRRDGGPDGGRRSGHGQALPRPRQCPHGFPSGPAGERHRPRPAGGHGISALPRGLPPGRAGGDELPHSLPKAGPGAARHPVAGHHHRPFAGKAGLPGPGVHRLHGDGRHPKELGHRRGRGAGGAGRLRPAVHLSPHGGGSPGGGGPLPGGRNRAHPPGAHPAVL